jgi:hypothetical protein
MRNDKLAIIIIIIIIEKMIRKIQGKQTLCWWKNPDLPQR